jgi:hypothetical protein
VARDPEHLEHRSDREQHAGHDEDRPRPEVNEALALRLHVCSIVRGPDDTFPRVSLRGRTIQETARLPDGRVVTVHVGVPEDPYIPRSELTTVDVELHAGDRVLAAVNTVLDPDQEGEAQRLAQKIAHGLESGELEPTAAAIEPLADTVL